MGKLKLLIYMSFISIITFSYQNCTKKETSTSKEPTTLQLLQSKSVVVLEEQCSACHTGDEAYSNTVLGSDPIIDISNVNYLLQMRLVVPGEPELSPLFQKIKTGDMPPGKPLSVEEVDTIKEWIVHLSDDPNSNSGGGLVTVPLAANFESLRVNVFLSKCNTCHINRNVRIDTYANVMNAINNNNLRSRVAGATMPPNNAPQLSAQERSLILQWIDSGAAP